uniref:uncharacterized protein LOC124002745 isoform X2 n=1 Tax=Oncorhynchus gorbuscha TaxID=8017 RepID=UPI001EAECD9C|nr:uncharacterized protein LOC124002745 isoform X2 [Oncorhynchus gorbuscha]
MCWANAVMQHVFLSAVMQLLKCVLPVNHPKVVVFLHEKEGNYSNLCPHVSITHLLLVFILPVSCLTKPFHFALVGDATMALRKPGSVFVVFLLSMAANTATRCGQQSQVMVPPTNVVKGQGVTLTCSNTCTLSDNPNPTYIWYKNGHRLDKHISQQYPIHIYYSDIYSCAVKGHEDLLSPAVCVQGQSCLNVTYTKRSICALKGSTVDITCTYRHPSWHNVTEVFWFNKWESGVTTDLIQDPEYAGRVKYQPTTDKGSTLRITDLRESDSAEYKFRFTTTEVKWGYSFPGITLIVTDLQVKETPGTEEGKVTLTCSTTCILTDNPTYIWKKASKSTSDTRDRRDTAENGQHRE